MYSRECIHEFAFGVALKQAASTMSTKICASFWSITASIIFTFIFVQTLYIRRKSINPGEIAIEAPGVDSSLDYECMIDTQTLGGTVVNPIQSIMIEVS